MAGGEDLGGWMEYEVGGERQVREVAVERGHSEGEGMCARDTGNSAAIERVRERENEREREKMREKVREREKKNERK